MPNVCKNCSCHFEITNDDLEFYQRIAPVFNDTPYTIPPPTICPDCRFQRRCIWRNEFTYYRRQCQLCQRKSISVHSPEKSYPVYCNRCWWSASWDPLKFGREIDLSESFFEQYLQLQRECPKPFLANDNHTTSENIEYCQGVAYSKNCYLATTSWRLEDCLYCSNCGESKCLVDCRFVGDGSELVYESATCQRCYSCSHLYACSGCSNCHFGIDLRGCSDCVGCVGLRNQKYCIFNQQYSQAEYTAMLERFEFGSYAKLQEMSVKFDHFANSQPQRGVVQINCERAFGNNLFNCKNFVGYNVFGGEDSKYYIIGTRPKNCYDILVGGEHEWCYEGVNPDHSYMSHFTVWCWGCTNTLYSDNCHSCRNIFGCVGLRRAEYCILNRQYSKAEYEQLVPQIIETMKRRGEWGEFFPLSVSQFAYNETVAQDYFPLNAEDAHAKGVSWVVKKSTPAGKEPVQVPEHIKDVSDNIVNQVLGCQGCDNNYKIAPLELRFYRQMGFAIPRKCPDCRRKDRFGRTGLFRTWWVPCANCARSTESATQHYERTQVLCDECYHQLF